MSADTIVAIATAPGAAGVGVVRVSGTMAVAVVSPLFRALDGRPLDEQPPRFLAFGRLFKPGGGLLDEVMVVRFAAPHSFTGEDVVEVQAHGGAFHLREVQSALLESSRRFDRPARLARPGEFTQRAFLNGKIDLTRAEAVADLIQSGSQLAREAAARQLGGGLQRTIEALRAETLGLLAECEAACDFPEEHEQLPDAGAAFQARLDGLILRLDALLDTAQAGRLITQGVRVALAGAPNAGKSSLFNALCGEERAIVSEEPGTTRDWLEVRVLSQGLTLLLYDTAGLREADAAVEAEGVRRTQALARDADVLLLVLDLSAPLDQRALGVLKDAGASVELALNKSDLKAAWDLEDLKRALAARGRQDAESLVDRARRVSARTREGLDLLLEGVVDSALKGRGTQRLEQVALTQARHERAALEARASLQRVRTAHGGGGAGVELLSVDLRAALESLGEIIGATPRAQVLEEIFRRFCIGK